MDVIKKIRNYTLNERHCLGEGSFGKVYEATSDEGRKVAIKKVDQKLIISDRYLKQSLDNQISIMQKLRHPNIVELYQVITTANNIYLIMQFCSGGDLKRYCSTRKVTEEVALKIITQITKGFQEMAKIGIIHRDLKPANILVHQENFKICDFGFAKLFGEAGKMARTFVGTPIYMSPQVLNQKNYTTKTDVWSLGVMFFQLLFGKLPYSGFSEQDLYRNITNRGLQIPECSKESQKLLKGMLVIDENHRWGWEDVFEALIGGKGTRPRTKTPVSPQVQNGLFYALDNNNNKKSKEKSIEQRIQRKQFDRKQQNPHPRNPPVTNNNYLDNYDHNRGVDRRFQRQLQRGLDYGRKPQIGKNMLIPQQQSLDQINLNPIANKRSQDKDENPRFFYFILVEFIVNPLEGSLSYDSFMFTLWKYTIGLYQKMIEKPEVTNIQLYKSVLGNQLVELKGLEGEFLVRKQGNLRSLADIVYQQAKGKQSNKKRLLWLKRFIDKKYTYEPIE